jgi:hypothetical protein
MKPRTERIELSNGEIFELQIYTEYNPGDSVWVMKIYTAQESLFGLTCDDESLKDIADEIWSKIQKNTDVAKIHVSGVYIKNSTNHYCGFLYSKRENGEWK